MFLDKVQKAHLIGIGGIGVSAVAKLLRLSGRQVTGSDLGESETIKEVKSLGIKVYKGHSAKNLEDDVGLIIYTSAAPENNPERIEGKKRGIKELSYFEFLGEYSREKFTVAVSGTHGKSTTTAMLGLMAAEAGLDPTVIVGSKVKNFQYGNLRVGQSVLFIVEACEHMANMLHLLPKMIVLTNIEADHLDYYKNLGNIIAAFKTYIQKLPANGKLIFNADDKNTLEVSKSFAGQKSSFGIQEHADYVGKEIRIDEGFQKYHFAGYDYLLRVPGLYNAYNALAASTAAMALGIESGVIKKTLEHFKGIWRRFEIIGERNGALIISDYGHHPTAVRETIAGARQFYPGRRLVLAFQPHHRNRTKNLFNEFVECFDGLDVLVLAKIFDVVGREQGEDVSSRELVEPIIARNKIGEVYFAKNLQTAEEKLLQIIRPGDIIIVMGAGDIYKIANSLIDN